MAEFVFKYILIRKGKENKYDVSSYATSFEEIGNDIYPPIKAILNKHMVPFQKREAQRITLDIYNNADLVLVMDNYNLYNLVRIVKDDSKIRLLGDFVNLGEISDPWYTRQFDLCYKEISSSCEALYEYLEKE